MSVSPAIKSPGAPLVAAGTPTFPVKVCPVDTAKPVVSVTPVFQLLPS